MAWDRDLSGSAYNIASSNENPLRVMAGPGTGKTFALMRRVARLLEQNVNPRRLLVVTFTRVAADDLIRELASLDIEGSENIRAGTLHSYCFSLLLQQEVFNYLQRNPRPLLYFLKSSVLQFEAAPLLRDINLTQFGTNRDKTEKIRAFEAAWARLQTDSPGCPPGPNEREFHQHLLDWLSFHNAILIGELVPLALQYLRDNPASTELISYDHILVDEYQDLNRAEQTLIDLLSANSNNTIIGDSDQSIYSFRYAHPEGILDFNTTHPTTHDETLLECRRCPKRVVGMANSLITNNYDSQVTVRVEPRISNIGGEIYIIQWNDLDTESENISRYVQHLLDREDINLGDILILSPRSLIGYKIKERLTEFNIPTHSFFNDEILSTELAQKKLSLLNLYVNPDERVSLRFLLGCGSAGWRSGEYARLRAYSEDSGLSPRTILDRVTTGEALITGISHLVDIYEQIANDLGDLENLEVIDLINVLFPEEEEELLNLRILSISLIEEEITPALLLEKIKVNIRQPEIPIEGDFVRIMSLHKSKGLTSKVVIVTSCIEGLIPSLNNRHTPTQARLNLEEQRRLFYVSITRTKQILVLSSIRMLQRDLAHRIGAIIGAGRGPYGSSASSRFLNELGACGPTPQRGLNWVNNGFI